MHVVLVVVGHLVVDDDGEPLDVEATCGDRGGDEHADVAILEVGDGRITIVLPHAAVQRGTWQVLLEELTEEVVARLLSVDEDELLPLVVMLAQQVAEPRQLLLRGEHLHVLLDHIRDDGDAADDDLHRLGEDRTRELLDSLWEGRREEQRLPVGPRVANDPVDLWREAHIEHAVGLIEHDVRGAAQVGHAPRVGREHVDHAPGRAHYDLGAALEFGDLGLEIGAAVHCGGCEADHLGELGDLAVDLHRQLARRYHHEADGAVAGRERWLVHYVPQQWQRVAHGLAAARLGDANDVAARHDGGQRLCLDREWLAVARLGDGAEQPVGEAALRPTLDGSWAALATHLDTVERFAQLLDLLLAHIADLGYLDVKVFTEGYVFDCAVVDLGQLLLLRSRGEHSILLVLLLVLALGRLYVLSRLGELFDERVHCVVAPL